MNEHFDRWQDGRTLTVYDPPRAVRVNMLLAMPFIGRLRNSSPPLRVRANGLRVEPEMPGQQLAWVQTWTGEYLALVEVPATSSNYANQIVLTLWVTEEMFHLDT